MRLLLISFSILVIAMPLAGQGPAERTANIPYAIVNGTPLRLDLYMPPGIPSPPLVVWVHGGAWAGGAKDGYPLPVGLVRSGFALASLEFRLSGEAPFPAQIHDIKAAIRFLRAKSKDYGYSADRIAIAGDSSGGHLAALVGTTNGEAGLEGKVGGYFEQSSSVQAIVDYYGPSNLTTILDQSTAFGLSVRVPALKLLLGALPDKNAELARLASPVFHVDGGDPPLLIFHGNEDPQVPIDQSYELEKAYKEHKLKVTLEVIRGAEHGDEIFYNSRNTGLAAKFLKETLRP